MSSTLKLQHCNGISRERNPKSHITSHSEASTVLYNRIQLSSLSGRSKSVMYAVSKRSPILLRRLSITIMNSGSLFASMKGMSEEQCVSLLDVYPTPAAFFEDLEDRMLCEMERESQGTVRYNKQSRKIQHFDPRNHVKNRIEPNNAYKPRPMGGPTTARLWHLATADDYSAREECFDFESQD